MSGPTDKVRIALQDMHDAFELDLKNREPDRAHLADIRAPIGPPLSSTQSMNFLKSRTERLTAALQFAATYHPVTTDGTIGLKMSVAFSVLLDATSSLQTDLAKVNPNSKFVGVFRGLSVSVGWRPS
jgi:hypothetical protein